MVDNFDLIRGLLTFDTDDDFYFIQVLKRRKDNPTLKGDVVVIKEYFVDSLTYFDKKREDMIEQAIKNNARVTIRLDKRSYKNIALKVLVDIAKKIDGGQFKSVKKSFSSCCGKFHSDSSKTWLIDVDEEDLLKYDIGTAIEIINISKPIDSDKIIMKIPSKTGYHLLVKPFDLRNFTRMFSTLEIKKNSPTNLYIP